MAKNRSFQKTWRRMALVAAGTVLLAIWIPSWKWAVTALGFAGVLVLFRRYQRERDRQVRSLHVAVRSMATGKRSLSAHASEEGELSLLEAEMYKLLQVQYELGERLEEQGTALADAMADISHQLKTPLTSVSVLTELLASKNLPEEKREEFLAHIGGETRRMEWLIRTLLQMAQLDAGVIVMHSERLAMRDLLGEVAERLAVSLDLANVSLRTEVEDGLTILCDRRWTQEALVNVIKNAIEHTPPGGVVTVRAGEDALAAWIEVEDEGKGIEPKDIPRLFDRFYRAKDAAPQSFGIGLALAKQVLERQEATISVHNAPHGGAVFTVRIYRFRKEEDRVY